MPLAFCGALFVPGEYHGHVAPVDLAATLTSLAGVNRPSAAVGCVLTEEIKMEEIKTQRLLGQKQGIQPLKRKIAAK